MTTFLRIGEVSNRVGMSRVTMWRMQRNGQFPKPVVINNRHFYPEDEIEAWIQDRIAERDTKSCRAPRATDAA